jgi:hypothetical protein
MPPHNPPPLPPRRVRFRPPQLHFVLAMQARVPVREQEQAGVHCRDVREGGRGVRGVLHAVQGGAAAGQAVLPGRGPGVRAVLAGIRVRRR